MIPFLVSSCASIAKAVFGIIPVAKTTKFDSTLVPSVKLTFSTISLPLISSIVVFNLNSIP